MRKTLLWNIVSLDHIGDRKLSGMFQRESTPCSSPMQMQKCVQMYKSNDWYEYGHFCLWFFIERFITGCVLHQNEFCYLLQEKGPLEYNIEPFLC